MKSLLREAMEEGAYGMSTGLDYPPGSYASTEELIELSREAAKLGGIYHTHCPPPPRATPRWTRSRRRSRSAGSPGSPRTSPTSTSGSAASTAPPSCSRLVEDAREKEDLDVTFDSYPYVFSGTRLLILFPEWVQEGGPEKIIAGFNDPEVRARLREEVRPRAGSLAGHVDHLLQAAAQPHLRGQVDRRACHHDRQARRSTR